jgi:hypothetical protein
MTRPERETAEPLDSTKTLSGTVSAFSVHQRRCDQVMSQQALAPFRVVHHFVSHGHDLEIPTTLWVRDSRTGHELRLDRLDPDGCVVRSFSKPTVEGPGTNRRDGQLVRHSLQRLEEDFSSCAACVYLTGAFLWAWFKNSRASQKDCLSIEGHTAELGCPAV